jgi:hypothetical protein
MMKKSKLIEMLNRLEGDPEIKLWNGMVGDWMDIDRELVPSDLVKQSLEHWLEMCRIEACKDRRDWDYQLPAEEVAALKKDYNRVNTWELNPYVTLEDVQEKRYKLKNIYILNAKTKGVKAFDRLGDIDY